MPESDYGTQDVIREFARKNRLRTRTDACGELVIPGKTRRFTACHIYQHSLDGKVFGAALLAEGSGQLPRGCWIKARMALAAAGCTVGQSADNEGTVLFDPSNRASTEAVLQACHIYRRRTVAMSEERKAELSGRLARMRARRPSNPT
jgi:hypothetical protein